MFFISFTVEDKAGFIMKKRPMSDYPADLTPEHELRGNGHDNMEDNDLHPDVDAAYDYVDSVIDTSDFTEPLAWHGWALREAFLAGISHASKKDE